MTNGKFNPVDYDWSWQGSILGTTVFQTKKSSVQSMPNGNLIFCETGLGRISEITKNGDHKWTYVNPSGTNVLNQFEIPINVDMFKAEKYPANYEGFIGKDLTPMGTIENSNANSDSCALTINTTIISENELKIVNPVVGGFIDFCQDVNFDKIVIYHTNGEKVFEFDDFQGRHLNIDIPSSLYLVQLEYNDLVLRKKIIIL